MEDYCRDCGKTAQHGQGLDHRLWCPKFYEPLRPVQNVDLGMWERRYTREDVTRALTAQAWAVACATRGLLDAPPESTYEHGHHDGQADTARSIAALPAPADLAEELLR